MLMQQGHMFVLVLCVCFVIPFFALFLCFFLSCILNSVLSVDQEIFAGINFRLFNFHLV